MNWDALGDALARESSGKAPRLFSSRKTLFGIPSSLDQELEAMSQHNEACQNALLSEANAKTGSTQHPTHVSHPLQPLYDEHSRVLILGTMPSPKSRETGFYYNHPQNRFWKVMASLFNSAVPQTNEEKRQLMLTNKIALWDVLAECTIEGASDASIAECVPNNIASITSKTPIQAVFCTGAKATELYNKYCFEQTKMSCIKLPSTSPANAALSLEQLIEQYKQILNYV